MPELINSNRELTRKSAEFLVKKKPHTTVLFSDPSSPGSHSDRLRNARSPAAARVATVIDAKIYESQNLPFRKDTTYHKFVRSNDRLALLIDEITKKSTNESNVSDLERLRCVSPSGISATTNEGLDQRRYLRTTFQLPTLKENPSKGFAKRNTMQPGKAAARDVIRLRKTVSPWLDLLSAPKTTTKRKVPVGRLKKVLAKAQKSDRRGLSSSTKCSRP
ncbi:MAG: hypothetical protein P4M11_15475 [Candidatus Pacebacteria bacterium]|nr:hypothetical protein [Candidatus Paceibacterota bacterium]